MIQRMNLKSDHNGITERVLNLLEGGPKCATEIAVALFNNQSNMRIKSLLESLTSQGQIVCEEYKPPRGPKSFRYRLRE